MHDKKRCVPIRYLARHHLLPAFHASAACKMKRGGIAPAPRRSRTDSAASAYITFFGEHQFTALAMTLRTFSSMKTGFVSCPGWK